MNATEHHGEYRSTRRGAAGITLVELLVVVSIASVVLGLVLPAVGAGMTGMQLRSGAKQMAAVINEARGKAISRQRVQVISLDFASGNLAIRELGAGQGTEFHLPVGLRLEDATGEPMEVAADAQGRQARHWVVYPDGAVPPIALRIHAGSRSVSVIADPLTGDVRVQEEIRAQDAG